jgi:hypothetical protein
VTGEALASDPQLRRRLSASVPLLMRLQIHRHLGGKALSFNIRETFKTEREEKLKGEDEVRLAETSSPHDFRWRGQPSSSKNVSQIS